MVDALVAAVEAKDPAAVLEYIDYGFRSEPSDAQQSLDHGAVRSIVYEFLLRDAPLGARALDVSVTPADEERYRVRTEVWFAPGGSLRAAAAPLPAGAVRYAFDILFAREQERWLAVGGSFERVGGR